MCFAKTVDMLIQHIVGLVMGYGMAAIALWQIVRQMNNVIEREGHASWTGEEPAAPPMRRAA